MRTVFASIILLISFVTQADYQIKQLPTKKVMICNSEDSIRIVHKALLTAQPATLVKLLDDYDCIELKHDFKFKVMMTIDRLYAYALPKDPNLPRNLNGFWILTYQKPNVNDDAGAVADMDVDMWFE